MKRKKILPDNILLTISLVVQKVLCALSGSMEDFLAVIATVQVKLANLSVLRPDSRGALS